MPLVNVNLLINLRCVSLNQLQGFCSLISILSKDLGLKLPLRKTHSSLLSIQNSRFSIFWPNCYFCLHLKTLQIPKINFYFKNLLFWHPKFTRQLWSVNYFGQTFIIFYRWLICSQFILQKLQNLSLLSFFEHLFFSL